MFAFFVTTRFASALALIAMLSGLAAGVVFGLLAAKRRRRRCKTCRWWGDEEDDVARQATEYPCAHEKLGGGWATRVSHSDGCCGDECGTIYCGPDFGCIHWEGKDSR